MLGDYLITADLQQAFPFVKLGMSDFLHISDLNKKGATLAHYQDNN